MYQISNLPGKRVAVDEMAQLMFECRWAGRLLALETCVTLSRKGGYARILSDLRFLIGHQDIILEERLLLIGHRSCQ